MPDGDEYELRVSERERVLITNALQNHSEILRKVMFGGSPAIYSDTISDEATTAAALATQLGNKADHIKRPNY